MTRMESSKIILPPKYYLQHFEDFICDTLKNLSHLMGEAHKNYIRDYLSLSENAKCLLIRMINRTGDIFDPETFHYEEISNINESWIDVEKKHLIRPLKDQDLSAFMSWLKKDQLKEVLLKTGVTFKKTASRDELQQLALSSQIKMQELMAFFPKIVVLNRSEDIRYLMFLYFGKLQSKLILPTLRDLGIKKSNKLSAFQAKFKSLEEALSHYTYSELALDHKKNKRGFSLEEIQAWPKALLIETKLLREDLLLKSAKNAETQDIEILKLCTDYPATAQRVRLYHQLGQVDECLKELERMMDDPLSDEELLFAEDFLLRKFQKKRLSHLTETLRNAEKISIDESFYRHPELGVVEHFKKLGFKGHFSENELWVHLFWTYFEKELESSKHSEFDHALPDLVEKTFYTKFEKQFKDRFSSCQKAELTALFEQEMIQDFIEVTPLEKIFQMLSYLAQDYYTRCSGFPDIFVIENGEAIFYEIKAPGDSLRPSQIKQMRQLEKVGFKVKVLQVDYKLNPEQTYVVVDLETTGMLTSWNRITEIGAVKIKGREVIETFQTLINPKRSIPSMIQGLTGITDEMVRDAPPFEEIAKKFQAFCEGSIFVAHNVSFDYGFLQHEFSRLEEKFVKPHICTKAWMKKYYPGLPAYGLGKLCQTFQISLTSHHRALCDAEAAAQLLLLINEKRA